MFKRGVALFVSCAVSSVAFAGATIVLVPNPSGPTYSAGDMITVDVWLSQDPGSDIALRMVQFDVSDTEINEDRTEGLDIIFPQVVQCGAIRFWDFSSTVVGQNNPINCGDNHYIDFRRDDSLPCCPEILAIAYGSATALGENFDEQLVLPGNGDSIRVGMLNVTIMSGTPDGTYTLDVINADNDNVADPDLGAQVRWGFGTNIAPGNNPLTNWRPGSGLSGGTLDLVVAPPIVCVTALGSTPSCDGVLPRTQRTVIRVQYQTDPTQQQLDDIMIRPLLDDGDFGTNLRDQFLVELEAGSVVKFTNTGTPLLNETWYGISDGCNEFQFVTIYGDANGDGNTNAFDVNDIWGNRGAGVPSGSPYDIDGDGTINAFDVNAAWGNRAPTVPSKPSLHACPG